MLIWTVFVVIGLLEYLLFTKLVWRVRTTALYLLAISLPATTLALYMSVGYPFFELFVLMTVFRVFNYLRIAKSRMHEDHLRHSTRRTSYFFMIIQLLVALTGYWLSSTKIYIDLFALILALQLLTALAIVVFTTYNLAKTRPRDSSSHYSDKELPTVSLLIPARNETLDLEMCLKSALASDYPKLEIIVLDDCSQKKTSDIIKSFAHDGVRFVKGDEPNDSWLAKNYAYQKLVAESSGEVLLFSGVDVRFGQASIRRLVTELLDRNKQMISILPVREGNSISGAFIQPIRYWWELSLPRKLFNRPPVLSTAWLIRKQALHKLGDFKSVRQSIIPEVYFAKELIKTDGYSFIRSNEYLEVATSKTLLEQRNTAVRVRYPQFRRRPENVFLAVSINLLFLIGPYIFLILSIAKSDTLGIAISILSCTLLTVNHLIIIKSTSPSNAFIALINLPIEAITEMYITIISMVRYELGTMQWKDRNVCIPVMHITSHLPRK